MDRRFASRFEEQSQIRVRFVPEDVRFFSVIVVRRRARLDGRTNFVETSIREFCTTRNEPFHLIDNKYRKVSLPITK